MKDRVTFLPFFNVRLFQDVFPDKATERKILSLAIKCPSEGCKWTGELRSKEVNTSLNSMVLLPGYFRVDQLTLGRARYNS